MIQWRTDCLYVAQSLRAHGRTIYGLDRREGRGQERRQQQFGGAEAGEEEPTAFNPMRNLSEEK